MIPLYVIILILGIAIGVKGTSLYYIAQEKEQIEASEVVKQRLKRINDSLLDALIAEQAKINVRQCKK